MAIEHAIQRALKRRKEKNYPITYIAVDMHGVILRPDYKENSFGGDPYPGALETLRYLSMREDIYLILFTSTRKDQIDKALDYFDENGINFDNVNDSDIKDDDLCMFDKKFYFDIMLDDKAGFNGETDWKIVFEEIKNGY